MQLLHFALLHFHAHSLGRAEANFGQVVDVIQIPMFLLPPVTVQH